MADYRTYERVSDIDLEFVRLSAHNAIFPLKLPLLILDEKGFFQTFFYVFVLTRDNIRNTIHLIVNLASPKYLSRKLVHQFTLVKHKTHPSTLISIKAPQRETSEAWCLSILNEAQLATTLH